MGFWGPGKNEIAIKITITRERMGLIEELSKKLGISNEEYFRRALDTFQCIAERTNEDGVTHLDNGTEIKFEYSSRRPNLFLVK